MRARAPSELDYVPEASGCDQPAARQLAFEKRVGGDRRAMNEHCKVCGIDTSLSERSEDADCLIFRRAWNLGVFDRARCLVIDDKVSEGAADIASDDRLRSSSSQASDAGGGAN